MDKIRANIDQVKDYIYLRTTLVSGLYWTTRSCMMRQYAVFMGTFSLLSNSMRTSTIALLIVLPRAID